MNHRTILPLLLAFLPVLGASAQTDSSSPIIGPRSPREFPKIASQAEWESRATTIRQQILVDVGLWPMSEKTPLNAKIFGKLERDGYSIEKAYLQPVPGFYLCGNLYRPLGRGNGPFPAILTPHGHWDHGRLEDTDRCSIPARCINFARQGFVVFAYDLVGYNDTHFADSPTNIPFTVIHRSFATNNPAAQLWNVTLMGLQTWDSLRALDFLASLPDVDPHRIGVTGESGGGTQTFMLGAIDDRIAAQSPVVMVSHVMQGGCLCENMPGLRVEFSNMEIAAAAAPRPQLLIGVTGDWTRTMTNIEGPAIQGIYKLFGVPDDLQYVEFPFPHNCNQTSREALYQWFDHQLLGKPDGPVKEVAYKKESDADMRVFPDGKLPPDALTEAGLIQYLIDGHKSTLRELEPKNEASLANYKKIMEPAWRDTLELEGRSMSGFDITNAETAKHDFYASRDLVYCAGLSKPISVLYFSQFAAMQTGSPTVILADPQGASAFCDPGNVPKHLARLLLSNYFDVAVVEDFPVVKTNEETSIIFNTYNRTYFQEQVRCLSAVYDLVKQLHHDPFDPAKVFLCGTGEAGLCSLMAAPMVDGVIADCCQLDSSKDENILVPGLFCPGIRNIDTFAGAPILAAPHPLLLHNVAPTFPTETLHETYKILGDEKDFKCEPHVLTDEEIVTWISQLKNGVPK